MIVFEYELVQFQGAQQANRQQHGTSVALICVKMASVMGVTWILGIVANLKALSFLWYPYVVLNSLQGTYLIIAQSQIEPCFVLQQDQHKATNKFNI